MASPSKIPTAIEVQSTQETCKLDDFIKDGFLTFVEATKAANDLPKGREYDYHDTHASFSSTMNTQSDHLLQLISRVLNANGIKGNIKSASLACKEELIGDANDVILDRAVAAIDELNGLRSLPAAPVIQTVSANIPVNGSWNKVNNFTVKDGCTKMTQFSPESVHLLAAKNIVRPQTYFKDKVDNGNTNPWKPRITEKPNSMKPLALFLEPSEEDDGLEEWSHPYEYELDHFKVLEEFLVKVDKPQPVKHIDVTPLLEITTEKQLDDLVEELRKHKEIAVDLEHHSYRTFQGITCLMQISTRYADYLVDTLLLRHKLYVLNEVFTKPSILKIFHGADMDVLWLQRDLSLYVVNMFDTHRAAKILGYSGLSLAYLLNRFCSFMPNKKFRLADWRIRPLPAALKDYAREDTHYLIYVYEMLKRELRRKANGGDNLLRGVFQASTEVCKTRYIKPRWTPDAHLKFYRRCKKMFDNRQMYALKEIYKWRDAVARDDDECTGYVLPNHMMLQIAEMLPREVQGILACCSPIPPLVRAHSLELHHIILKAREQPLEKPIMQESNRRLVSKETVRINIESPLHCPHDSTKMDHKNNLPALLDSSSVPQLGGENANVLPLEQLTSSCKIFNDTADETRAVAKKPKFSFLGPFERYKLIRPYLQAEAEKAKLEIEVKEKAAAEDDPSVIDRIAALHAHFVQSHSTKPVEVSAEKAPVQPRTDFAKPSASIIHLDISQPLINMAGSKKRKRDESPNRFSVILPEDGADWDENGSDAPMGNEQHKKRKRSRDRQSQQISYLRGQQHKNHLGRGKKNQRGGKSAYCPARDTAAQSFDYSNVDYSQFGGGGKTVGHKQDEISRLGRGQNQRGGRRGRGRGGRNQSMTFQPTRGRGTHPGRNFRRF